MQVWPASLGWTCQILLAIVLDDGSRSAAISDRQIPNSDGLAGHQPCATPEPLLPRQARAPEYAALADELTHRPEEFRVQVPAPDAGQPTSGPGQAVRRIDCQCVAAIFTADRDGDDDGYPHHHARDEDSDGND
jgi:hypothetical protein